MDEQVHVYSDQKVGKRSKSPPLSERDQSITFERGKSTNDAENRKITSYQYRYVIWKHRGKS